MPRASCKRPAWRLDGFDHCSDHFHVGFAICDSLYPGCNFNTYVYIYIYCICINMYIYIYEYLYGSRMPSYNLTNHRSYWSLIKLGIFPGCQWPPEFQHPEGSVLRCDTSPEKLTFSRLENHYFLIGDTLPETKMAPENRPLEKEIPIGNHHF